MQDSTLWLQRQSVRMAVTDYDAPGSISARREDYRHASIPAREQSNLCLTSAILIIAPAFHGSVAAETNQTAVGSINEDFWLKVTIAIISALLAFAGSYSLWRLQERRKPRQQISYEVSIQRPIPRLRDKLGPDIKVSYRSRTVADLHRITCRTQNTCNTVIMTAHWLLSTSSGGGMRGRSLA